VPEGAILLALVTLQRLGELIHARRNTARLLAHGGREVGARHYPLIVALHGGWLAALWLAGWQAALIWPWVAVYALLQVLRAWILASLGPRWTTRIIIVDAPLCRRGPYRFLRHPNYLLVAAEIACVPLALGLPWLALVFSAANAGMLYHRIKVENAALAGNKRN